MIKENKITLIITTLVLLLPMIIGLLLWDTIPDQVPIHWGMDGQADQWGSKGILVFGLPIMMLGIHWLCIFAYTQDPKNKTNSKKPLALVLWLSPVLSLVLFTLSYTAALGMGPKVEILLPLILGAMFLIIGNLLPKCKQSYTLGIRLPWTLHSKENWNKTHRFAGRIWLIGGALIMASAVLNNLLITVSLLIVMVLLPILYSYLYHRREK